MPQSNELRVFISSTFRDLQEEREHLIKKIFPEIRVLCRERGVTFTEIDLRWGLTEEEATLGRVIRTCLEEVDKCRPYFIGMVGNRYGWAPKLHEILRDPDLLLEYPWIEELMTDGASVTEMEFIHGVFNASRAEGSPGRSDGGTMFFYHRSGDISEADDPERLSALIERSRATGKPFREFDGIEELGKQVYDDLVGMIDRLWSQSEAPSPLALERRAHAAFAASRVRAYIPRTEYLKRFSEWMGGGDQGSGIGASGHSSPTSSPRPPTPLIIAGASGLGKSSLIAYLIEYYRKKHPIALVIEHYIGASEGSGSSASVIRFVIGEICERFGITEELSAQEEELEKSFPNWLFRCEHLARQTGVSVLIAIDAVNQLDESGRRLSWLPKTIPSGVKLIVSTTPGQTDDKLAEREWERLIVTPLEDERVRQSIVVRYLGEYHKGISPEQLRHVITDPKASSPLYLRVIAEELRLHGEHETLDEMIARYTEGVDLLEVFERVLERIEEDYGASSVREMLSLIEASRGGVSEVELLELTGMSRIDLSRLLSAFDYHLLHRDGLLGFFHDYLRRTVKKRYLSDEALRRRTHQRLAEYFAQSGQSQRSAREQLWGYWQSGDDGSVVRTLSRLDLLELLYTGAGEYEVLTYWARLCQVGHDPEAIYRQSLEQYGNATSESAWMKATSIVAGVLEQLGLWLPAIDLNRRLLDVAVAGGFASEAAGAEASLGRLLQLRGEHAEALSHLEHALESYEKLGDRNGVSRTVGNIGVVYHNRGEYDRALQCYDRQLRLAEELGDESGVSVAVRSMGVVYYERGEHERALRCYERTLRIAEELGDRRGVSVAIGNMGIVYYDRAEYERALESLNRTLRIAEELGDRRVVSIAIASMGIVYYNRGEYERALESYERQLRIAEELGDRRVVSQAIGNMGEVYSARGEYERALENYARASDEQRAIGFRYGLIYWLEGIARVLLELLEAGDTLPTYLPHYVAGLVDADMAQRRRLCLRAAREHVEECMAIAKELSKSHKVFGAGVLLARVDAAQGDSELAHARLLGLLQQADDDTERAELHYWLWRVGRMEDEGRRREEGGGTEEVEDHRIEALRLYKSLIAKAPKHEYRKRIEELTITPKIEADNV